MPTTRKIETTVSPLKTIHRKSSNKSLKEKAINNKNKQKLAELPPIKNQDKQNKRLNRMVILENR